MVSSNKILTVSYGTFSCTAEGFEDPLAVVKETTQFFRGVVGEDRFFGAEPPQVDPELASELMRQQITAEADGGHVTLRGPLAAGAASAGALTAALAAGAARPARAEDLGLPDDDTIEATAEYIIRDEDDAEDDDFDITALDGLTEAEPEDAPRQPDPDSVAAKLQRIRAVVDDNAEVAQAPLLEDTPEEDLEEDGIDAMLSALGRDDAIAEADDEDLDPVDDVSAPNLSDSIAGLMMSETLVSDDAEEDDILTALAAEDDEDEDDDLYADDEDEDDEDLYAAAEDDIAEDEDDFDDEDDEDDDDLYAAADEELSEDEDLFDDDDDEDDEDLYAASEEELAEDDDIFAAADADDEEDDDLDEWEGFTEEDAPVAAAPTTAEDFDDDLYEEEAEEAIAPAPQPAPPAPVRARVVKVKRAVFEEAVARGQLEEVDEDDDQPAPVPGAATSSLSREEEDELARELAAVKAELSGALDDDDWDEDEEDEPQSYAPPARTARRAEAAPAPKASDGWDDLDEDDDDWDDEEFDEAPRNAAPASPLRLNNPVAAPKRSWDADLDDLDAKARRAAAELHGEDDEDDSYLEGARKAVKMASPARAMLTEQRVEDNDTSRILDQTDKELEEPEGNRRRSAIAHLRAAVAATRADKLLGRGRNAEEAAEPYREDLASVVRPRRPQAGSGRSERPSEATARPTPLKLVAEQRIGESDASAAPVRPRRVGRGDLVTAASTAPRPVRDMAQEPVSGGEGFADYARSVGARDLPQLIEAAASFITYVLGRDEFSRPQLMTTLREAETEESSREDRLRLFGQLLREGKIEKTTGGRFTVSESIRFKPRRAVG